MCLCFIEREKKDGKGGQEEREIEFSCTSTPWLGSVKRESRRGKKKDVTSKVRRHFAKAPMGEGEGCVCVEESRSVVGNSVGVENLISCRGAAASRCQLDRLDTSCWSPAIGPRSLGGRGACRVTSCGTQGRRAGDGGGVFTHWGYSNGELGFALSGVTTCALPTHQSERQLRMHTYVATRPLSPQQALPQPKKSTWTLTSSVC